jgi:RNA polymerase sigma factor (sigma-70 family)
MTRLRGAYRGALFHQLESLFVQGTSVGSTEGELLERFVTRRDEAAFEALVARHGPMVLGVCRQLLRDPNDVDDAFQATFLILVRKAGTLRRCDLLGNWLYGVAYRVAVRARALAARRLNRVAFGHELANSVSDVECTHKLALDEAILLESSPWLHQEVSRLPEKYRMPIVLCYFEGLTHDEAASRLGWPLGTVKGRLARARDLLRRRLVRRGITLSATALASHLTASEAKAGVGASLQLMTLRAAQALLTRTGASLGSAWAISIPVSNLVEGVSHAMIANQVKTIVLPVVLVAGSVATGVVVGGTQLLGQQARDGKAGRTVQGPAAGSATRDDRPAGAKAASSSSGDTSPLVSSHLAQQYRAARDSFNKLLSTYGDPDVADIDRLSRWSSLTLEADLELGTTDLDRVAAYQAHRDRMKILHELTQKIPVSAKNQPVKADHTQLKLQEAEQLLDAAKQGPPGGMMGAMSNHMRAGMRAGSKMGQGPPLGMMGGMMRGMLKGTDERSAMKKGAVASVPAGSSSTSELPPSEAPNEIGKSSRPEDGAAAKNSSDELPKQQSIARAGGPNKPGNRVGAIGGGFGPMSGGMAGMGGLGGGMGGVGGGMGGMGGGMAGMGGMGGMMASMSPEDWNRQARVRLAASAAELAMRETNPKSKAVLKKLDEPIAMSFAADTPLEDMLKYIKIATTDATYAGIPIYVDPKGLKEADATLTSTVTLDLEGVPLKTTLRLMLKQLGLAYCVRDGVLLISSVEGINEELREAESELQASDPNRAGS